MEVSKIGPPKRLPRTYQILKLPDGSYFTRPHSERERSRFWNEGKWRTFIEPLLPEPESHAPLSDQTFIEMGTATGLFLKLAMDHGYSRVIGLEKNRTPHAIACRYRDEIGYGYTVLKRRLGTDFHEAGTFDFDELPLADVTLLSNFHYHIDLNNWIKYVDRLKFKTRYVIVVSISSFNRRQWQPGTSLTQVRTYFTDWEEIRTVKDVPQEDDPSPRPLYSVLFKSPILDRIPFSQITHPKGNEADGIKDLAQQVMNGNEIDVTKTLFWQDWRGREPAWSERTLRAFSESKLMMVQSIVSVGPKDPILIMGSNQRLRDGSHRATILETMGYESAIVRRV